MKAMVYERYGPPEVVVPREVETPAPKHDELLIRIHATTVSSGDWRARSLEMPAGVGPLARLAFGIRRPRQPILGTELAGTVAAVGTSVRTFQVGDEVVAFPGPRLGCHAEYRCMPESGMVARKPANLTFEEAAALSFGGMTALDFFRRGKLRQGERILINGASGAVGSAAVQIARHLGANVTGVCRTPNVDLVRSLGADHVIDYTREDFTRNGQTYDVIMNTTGTAPFSRCRDSLADGGRLLLVLGGLRDLLQAPWVAMTSRKRIIAGPGAVNLDDLRRLAELAGSGAYRPVIDRRYRFEEIVEAHRYVDTGRKKGSVVITLV